MAHRLSGIVTAVVQVPSLARELLEASLDQKKKRSLPHGPDKHTWQMPEKPERQVRLHGNVEGKVGGQGRDTWGDPVGREQVRKCLLALGADSAAEVAVLSPQP